MLRRALLAAALLAAAAPARAAVAATLPPVGHVWVVVLENTNYADAFEHNPNRYLSRDLPAAGALLREYHATGHFSLDNYLSMISGQAPNLLTQTDCPFVTDVAPAVPAPMGQVVGQGCVYPAAVKTIADQVEAKGLEWKGYMEDLGNDPGREDPRCGAPAIGAPDHTQTATATDAYAARHNPFVYFHSLRDDPARCAAHVGPLPPLADDLKSIATTPAFSFITPNLCDDGHDATCRNTNVKGTHEGGRFAMDAWLQKWVPVITASPAFRRDGMLVVTFDEAENADAGACCEEPTGPNTSLPGQTGPGGGRVGAVVLSPFVAPGTTSDVPYNHYSLLRSLEDLLGIPEHLGYAALPGLRSFGSDVFTRPQGRPTRATLTVGTAIPGGAVALGRALRRGLPVRVTLAGGDGAAVRARLSRARGRHAVLVASAGHARTLEGGRGILRLRRRGRARVVPGTYRLVVAAVRGGRVVASARRTVRVAG